MSKLFFTESLDILTANGRISMVDRYLMKDWVEFGGMDFPS